MRLIDAEPIIKNLSAMKTQLGYDAIDIDGMIKALKEAEEVEATTQPNDPLTISELQEMDGKPVWCKECSRYGIICVDTKGIWEGIPFFSFRHEGVDFCWNVDNRNLTLYRCKPEEGFDLWHIGKTI